MNKTRLLTIIIPSIYFSDLSMNYITQEDSVIIINRIKTMLGI